MILTFAGELTKMIDAGLGRESAAPDTGVAVGRYSEYIEVSDAAIATFDTNAALPLRALTVDIEPIQDLHGQESPYPAGGGKNLCPIATMDTTSGGNINASCGAVGTVEAGVTYTFSLVNKTTSTANLRVRMVIDGEYSDVASGNLVSGGSKSYTFTPTVSGEVTLNASIGSVYSPAFENLQLEKGSTATAYAPYSNICPISGRSEVRVWREATYDTSADPALTIPLGQTVYGGTVDAVSGVMTVDRKIVNLGDYTWSKNGNAFYIASITDMWLDERVGSTSIGSGISNVYAFTGTTGYQSNPAGFTMYYNYGYSGYRLFIHDAAAESMTVAGFKARLQTLGATLCYKLASPLTIQLTAQQLATLLGTNNVWSDGGNVSLTYTKYNYTEGY